MSAVVAWRNTLFRRETSHFLSRNARPCPLATLRFGSTSTNDAPNDVDYVTSNFVVHRRGDPGYGSREYVLLPPHTTLQDAERDGSLVVAAIRAHRNILFSARSFHGHPLPHVCLPLVDVALSEAGEQGDQPQAMSTLYGLCDWVKQCMDGTDSSDVLSKLKSDDPDGFAAVQAIATGIPREGHSVVGVGTYRDGEKGWKALAKEFVVTGRSEEATLYKMRGGELVGIEHLADKNPNYLKTAGGAMARLFFL